MNDPEKTQSLLAQEAHEQALQEKPAAFQEHFPGLDEEVLEKVIGAGICCSKVFSVFKKSSPVPPIDKGKGIAPPTPLQSPTAREHKEVPLADDPNTRVYKGSSSRWHEIP